MEENFEPDYIPFIPVKGLIKHRQIEPYDLSELNVDVDVIVFFGLDIYFNEEQYWRIGKAEWVDEGSGEGDENIRVHPHDVVVFEDSERVTWDITQESDMRIVVKANVLLPGEESGSGSGEGDYYGYWNIGLSDGTEGGETTTPIHSHDKIVFENTSTVKWSITEESDSRVVVRATSIGNNGGETTCCGPCNPCRCNVWTLNGPYIIPEDLPNGGERTTGIVTEIWENGTVTFVDTDSVKWTLAATTPGHATIEANVDDYQYWILRHQQPIEESGSGSGSGEESGSGSGSGEESGSGTSYLEDEYWIHRHDRVTFRDTETMRWNVWSESDSEVYVEAESVVNGADDYEYWRIRGGDSSPKIPEFGILYNWAVISDSRGIAPEGYRVPTRSEIMSLINDNGFGSFVYELFEPGTDFWWQNLGTNTSGFSARGSGYRNLLSQGTFSGLTNGCVLWTNYDGPPAGEGEASAQFLGIGSEPYVYAISKNDGCSIRFIRESLTGWQENETVRDFDGNIYPTVQIGDQIWTTINLMTEHFNDGSLITNVQDNDEWFALTDAACCFYENDATNAYIIEEDSGSGDGELRVHSHDLVEFMNTETIEFVVTEISGTEIKVEANVIGGTTGEQVQSDWEQSDSGEPDYIWNKPEIPTQLDQIQADWEQSDTGEPDYIKNKPESFLTGMIEDREWSFADIIAGTIQDYDIDIKAKWEYTILSVVLRTDTGQLDNVVLKINGTAIGGFEAIDVTTAITETNATSANDVESGDRVTIHTTEDYSGSPTYLGGKIVIQRV